MRTDLRLLLFIIGVVLAGYVVFMALRRYRGKSKTHSHDIFDETVFENPHYQEIEQREDNDPLIYDSENREEKFEHKIDIQESYQEDLHLDQEIEEAMTQPVSEAEMKPSLAQDEFIAISIIARQTSGFPGHLLLSTLKANHCYLSGQKAFQRYLNDNLKQPVLFNILSLVEPGVFDVDEMSYRSFPGVLMLMVFSSDLVNPMLAFDKMLITARQMAVTLNGELCDGRRQPLTIQKIAALRLRIKEHCELSAYTLPN